MSVQAELVPPVLTDDLVLVDLFAAPEVAIAVLVQVDSLEDVLLEWDIRWELTLVVCAVEAHLELGLVLGIHLDVVHGLERLLCVLQSLRLVDARKAGDGLLVVIEVLVVVLHVVAIPVGNRDIVRKLGRAEDLFLAKRGTWCKDTLSGVGTVAG
jgi:hypothetical protein